MKAIVCTKYGPPDVLKLKEVKKPIPKDNEILIRIYATTVTSGDARIRSFNVPFLLWIPFRIVMGLTKPRKNILGFEFAGQIEKIGKNVTLFKEGEQVFGSAGFNGGCYAEYICLSEKEVLTTIPENINYEEAAGIFFAGHTALHFLRKGNIQSGQKVLVYGASGALGTYAIQLAKYFGTEVTGICSTSNLELVRSLGADKVIDYTKEDFSKNGEKYDIIFDTVGKSSFNSCIKSLKKKGSYLRAVHLDLISIIKGLIVNIMTKKKVIGGVAAEHLEDVVFLKKLTQEGKIKSIIDRRYPLEQIVEAHKYVDKGHKKGNVVITIERRNKS